MSMASRARSIDHSVLCSMDFVDRVADKRNVVHGIVSIGPWIWLRVSASHRKIDHHHTRDVPRVDRTDIASPLRSCTGMGDKWSRTHCDRFAGSGSSALGTIEIESLDPLQSGRGSIEMSSWLDHRWSRTDRHCTANRSSDVLEAMVDSQRTQCPMTKSSSSDGRAHAVRWPRTHGRMSANEWPDVRERMPRSTRTDRRMFAKTLPDVREQMARCARTNRPTYAHRSSRRAIGGPLRECRN
jgi:hypothetical protein